MPEPGVGASGQQLGADRGTMENGGRPPAKNGVALLFAGAKDDVVLVVVVYFYSVEEPRLLRPDRTFAVVKVWENPPLPVSAASTRTPPNRPSSAHSSPPTRTRLNFLLAPGILPIAYRVCPLLDSYCFSCGGQHQRGAHLDHFSAVPLLHIVERTLGAALRPPATCRTN